MQAHLSLTVSNNYFYPSQVTLKNFQPKVGKQVHQVSNRYTFMTAKFLVFISSFYFFCCVPILCWKSWSLLLVVEHQQCHVPPISPFYQRNWYVGPFCGAFLGQIFLCFGGRMVLAPTLNSNSSRSHSIKSLLPAQFKRFLFFYSTTRQKPHCLQIIFVFAIINQSR